MHKIFIYSQSHFPINRRKIKKTIGQTLEKHGVTSDTEVTVNVIGDRKMTKLHTKYLNEEGTTDVLSFPLYEFSKTEKISFPKTKNANLIRLGDLVISYPQAQKQAAEHNLLVDDEINNLVDHGMLHLLGIHHEEKR